MRRATPEPRSPFLVAAGAFLLLGAAPAAAAELSRAADFDALCDLSETAEAVFSGLSEASPRPTDAPAEPDPGAAPALPDAIDPHAPAPRRGPDPVLAALRARQYARDRSEAIVDTYDVVVNAASFPRWSWDADLGSIVAYTGVDLEAFGPTRLISPVAPDSLLFPMSEADAEVVLAAYEMGAGSVRLTFALAAREQPWQPICRVDELATRLDVYIVSAELLDSYASPLVRAETVAWEAERVREVTHRTGIAGGGVPVVEVTAIEIEGDRGCTEEEGILLQAGIEALFADCYLTGLNRNANLHGAVVYTYTLGADGEVTDARVTIDVLDDERVRDCTLAALDRIAVPRSPDASPAIVRSSVRFSLRD